MLSDKPTEGESVAAALAEKDKAPAVSVRSAGQANELQNSDGLATAV